MILQDENLAESLRSIEFAFKRIGGKYKPKILWLLHTRKVMRYNEIRKSLMYIPAQRLTHILRELEVHKLITRKEYHGLSPKVEYSLTAVGTEPVAFIEFMRQWGNKEIEKDGYNKVCAN